MADSTPTTNLSSLIRDPFVRGRFRAGFAFAVPTAPVPELDGGAAAEIEEAAQV